MSYYGDKIVDAIVSGRMFRIENVYPNGTDHHDCEFDHNHLTVWAGNANEQLDALVRQFLADYIRSRCHCNCHNPDARAAMDIDEHPHCSDCFAAIQAECDI